MVAPTTTVTRLFSSGFEVLCTAVHPSEREQLQAVAHEHGIELVSSVRKGRPPHVVITRSVLSPKYRAVMRANPELPVVTPDWLLASAQQGKRLGYDGYRVGPFTGLTICFSGISAAKKQAMARQVLQVGGNHSAALDRKCTHLVTVSTESDKYKFAKREKIICVQPKWVEDCINRGWCQEEGQYLVMEQAEQDGMGKNKADLMSLRNGVNGGPADDTSLMCLPAPSGVAGGVSETRIVTGSEPSCAAISHPEEVQLQGSQRPSRFQHNSAVLQSVADDAAAPLIQLSPFREAAPDYDDLTFADNSLFLDSCKIHLAGCTPAEQVEMLRIVREGAAKRAADLLPGMTHILVGSDLTTAETADLVDYASSNLKTKFVTLDWLRQCKLRQEQVPVDDRFAIPISTLQGLRKKAPVLEQLESDSSLKRSSSVGQSGEDRGLARQTSLAMTGRLEGNQFTLTALRMKETPEQVAKVKEMILCNGGRVFDHVNTLVVKDKSKAYAICPQTLLPSEAAHLKSSFPDFKLVDEKHRFTVYWLECSLLAQRLLPCQHGTPLYQPLPFPLPLVDMNQVLVCISGYDPVVRASIQHTVEVLGGSASLSMTRKNTHLIVSEATGAKYNACPSFGVIPVNADWLLDSIALGRLQPEGNYPPLPPQGGAWNGLQAAGPHSNLPSEDNTTRSGGVGAASQLGVTQIGATQFPLGCGAQGSSLPSSLYQAAVAADREQLAAERPLASGAAALVRSVGVSSRQPQQQQPPSQGNTQRSGGLRARMTQARTGMPGQSNNENAPSALNLMDAEMAVPPWGGNSSRLQQHAQPSPQDSLLEDSGRGCAMQGGGAQPGRQVGAQPCTLLDDALEGLGPQPGPQPIQQQEQPPTSMFEQIFGSSSPPSGRVQQPTGAPHQHQQQAGTTPVAAVMRAVAALPLAPSPASVSPASANGLKSAGRGSEGRPSCRTRRTRPRPDSSAAAAMAVAEAALGGAAAALPFVEREGDACKGQLGADGRQQEQQQGGEGPDIQQMVDHIGGLLERVAAEQPVLGSQLDMLPPPPRSRGAKRPAREGGGDNESTLSNGSHGGGRSTRTRARRDHGAPAADAPSGSGNGRQLRRSGRGMKVEHEIDMSQQVGYDTSPTVLPARAARGAAANGSDAAAKQRLRQIAHRGSSRNKDENFLLQMAL